MPNSSSRPPRFRGNRSASDRGGVAAADPIVMGVERRSAALGVVNSDGMPAMGEGQWLYGGTDPDFGAVRRAAAVVQQLSPSAGRRSLRALRRRRQSGGDGDRDGSPFGGVDAARAEPWQDDAASRAEAGRGVGHTTEAAAAKSAERFTTAGATEAAGERP